MIVTALLTVALMAPAPAVSAKASLTAGKPVTVWCATSDSAWNQWVQNVYTTFDWPLPDYKLAGLTLHAGDSDTFLQSCTVLKAELNHRKVSLKTFGIRLLMLTHETQHMKGIVDESAADCAALKLLPSILGAWGVRPGADRRTVMRSAWAYHNAAPPQYKVYC